MTPQKVTWYFEPRDATTNERIAKMGEDVEECPDALCFDWQGKSRRANLWRVTDSKADFICNSRESRHLSFVLYKQIGEGDIKQIAAQRPIDEQKANLGLFKYKIPRMKRRKPWIKGSSLLRRMQRRAQQKHKASAR